MTDQRIEALRERQAAIRRRILRIRKVQSSLNIREHTAQMMYARISQQIWELEHSHKRVKDAANFQSHEADRVTAELCAFDPTRKPNAK